MLDVKVMNVRFRSGATPNPVRMTAADRQAQQYLSGARVVWSQAPRERGPFTVVSERLAWLAENGKVVAVSAIVSAAVAAGFVFAPAMASAQVQAVSQVEEVSVAQVVANAAVARALVADPVVARVLGLGGVQLRDARLAAVAGKRAVEYVRDHSDNAAMVERVDVVLMAAGEGAR